MSLSKRDAFNAVVVWALAHANEHMPLPVQLSMKDIPVALRDLLTEVATDEQEQATIWTESIHFLAREDYLIVKESRRYPAVFDPVRLTEKALYVLDAVPSGIGGATIGSKLKDAAKEAGKVGAQATVAETVGVMIGAAMRSLQGGA